MNKIKSAIGLFLTLTIFVITSCENEPVDPIIVPIPVENKIDVVGNYKLIVFNTAIKTDLNNDAVFSTNQMDETVCHLNNSIEIKSDNTFTATDRGIEIVKDENNIDLLNCFIDPLITGVWVLDGNNLTLTYTQGGVEFSMTYFASENVLSKTISSGKVVATNNLNKPVYITSDITKIYTKQP